MGEVLILVMILISAITTMVIFKSLEESRIGRYFANSGGFALLAGVISLAAGIGTFVGLAWLIELTNF